MYDVRTIQICRCTTRSRYNIETIVCVHKWTNPFENLHRSLSILTKLFQRQCKFFVAILTRPSFRSRETNERTRGLEKERVRERKMKLLESQREITVRRRPANKGARESTSEFHSIRTHAPTPIKRNFYLRNT